MSYSRPLPLLASALLIAGCGASYSTPTTTSTPATSSAAPLTRASPPASPATTPTPSRSSGAPTASPPGSSRSQSPPRTSAESSFRTYGSPASGARQQALAKLAFGFFSALASRDYAKLCGTLSASNIEQLRTMLRAEHQSGGCPRALKALIPAVIPEARKAATGALAAVRVKGDTAFVLFRPKGGVSSYFVLKREGHAWKAISLAPGTPLNPTATAP